jgi:hypothetical protein
MLATFQEIDATKKLVKQHFLATGVTQKPLSISTKIKHDYNKRILCL